MRLKARFFLLGVAGIFFAFDFAILLAVSDAGTYTSYCDFNPSSRILKENGIILVLAVYSLNEVLIVSRDNQAEDSQRKYLLGDDGKLYELKGKVSRGNEKLDWNCGGDDIVAASLRFKGSKAAGGFLVAIGAAVEKIIKWFPAHAIVPTPTVRLVPPLTGFRLKEITMYDAKGLRDQVFFASWKNEKLEMVPPPSGEHACSYLWDAFSVGLREEKTGKLTTIYWGARDCDGITKDESAKELNGIREFAGALRLADSETWLIFNAWEYEAERGYLMFRYMPGKPIEKTSAIKVWISAH